MDGESDAITRKAIELAKAGDMTAIRLCLERILPPRKDRPAIFTLPRLALDRQVDEKVWLNRRARPT